MLLTVQAQVRLRKSLSERFWILLRRKPTSDGAYERADWVLTR